MQNSPELPINIGAKCLVDIVIVAYNSAHVIEKAIKSASLNGNVIVVDNASSDQSAQLARSLDAQVIVNNKNLGFGVACNQGAAIGNSEFIIFLNPDAELLEGALENLISAARRFNDAGGFSPRILRKNGSQVFRNRSFLAKRRYGQSRRTLPQEDCDIIILSGAALFCRRAAFEQIGGFDEKIFLYFEDDDLSLRLKNSGWKLRYVHDAVVQHLGSASTKGKPGIEFFKGYHWSISLNYVAKKHSIFLPIRRKLFNVKLRKIVAKMTRQQSKKEYFEGIEAGLDFISKPH